jgi:hypothetical protein
MGVLLALFHGLELASLLYVKECGPVETIAQARKKPAPEQFRLHSA